MLNGMPPPRKSLSELEHQIMEILWAHGPATSEQVRVSGIGPGTVRLSIGLEDVDDLIADIDQALSR